MVQLCDFAYLFQFSEDTRPRSLAPHGFHNQGFWERFRTAWLSDYEQWDSVFYADYHHEHILFESFIFCNIPMNSWVNNSIDKEVLAAEKYKDMIQT